MREEAALAHLEVGRQAPDRQPVEAVGRGEVDGAVENRARVASPLVAVAISVARRGYRMARTFVRID